MAKAKIAPKAEGLQRRHLTRDEELAAAFRTKRKIKKKTRARGLSIKLRKFIIADLTKELTSARNAGFSEAGQEWACNALEKAIDVIAGRYDGDVIG